MRPHSPSPHLRPVPERKADPASEREIPVRFSSTTGLAVPVRRPFNSFRWVGPGTLRIADAGLVVSARRLGFLGLRPARRFIPRDEIRDVYREGSAIQIHLRGAGEPFFRFWAEHPSAAAEIVAQLPTEHTIEFETYTRLL